MALVDSLIFSDVIATIILLVILMVMVLILVEVMFQLSINDYYASISTYIFHECLSEDIKPINYTHIQVIMGFSNNEYLLVCPLVTYNQYTDKLNVTIYTALPR